MNIRTFCLLSAAVAVATATGAHAGKTYRWIDDKGRAHYSDVQAPRSASVDVRPASGLGANPTTKRETPQTKASRAEACLTKREQLSTYTSAAQVSETDALGKTKTYTPAEKQALIQRTQTQVNELCAQQPSG